MSSEEDRFLNVIAVHAVLMCTAWAVLAPIGLSIARYGKAYFGSRWLLLHLLVMAVVGLLTLAAFSLALWVASPHLQVAHQWIGWILSAGSVLQASGGLVLVYCTGLNLQVRNFCRKAHWLLGPLLLLLAWTNITLGMRDHPNLPSWAFGVWAVYVAGWIAVVVCLEKRKRNASVH